MTRLVRLAAATVLVAAAGLAGPAPAAYADACSTAAGVTVVVDFHELGGGLRQVCDADGGGQKAASLFPDSGFPLDYVQRQPGFVCRVSGAPADDPCVNTPPADAYWGLWWSNGENGSWTYSTVGVGSLTIPEGGSVALSWNGSTTKSPPGAAPPRHTSEPTGKPEPTKPPPSSSGPTQQPSQAPTTPGGGSTPTASPSTSPNGAASAEPRDRSRQDRDRDGDRGGRGQRDRDAEETPASEPSNKATLEVSQSEQSEPVTAEDGLPVWIGPLAVGALLAVAGVATYLRRRTS